MPQVIEDLENGHTVSEARGYTEIQRIFRVVNLTKTLQPWLLLLEALDDPDVPKVGDTYPDVSGSPGTSPYTKYTRCIVRSRQAFPMGCDSARIIVDYSNDPSSVYDQEIDFDQTNPTADVKSVSFSLEPVKTTKDADGNDVVIPPPVELGPLRKDYVAELEVLSPTGVLVFERTELRPATTEIRDYLGTLNEFAMGSGAYAAKTLKFDRLDQNQEDGGRTWRTVYEFSYRAAGWAQSVKWRNPETGTIPKEATETLVDVYPTSDFNDFGLDFTDTQTPVP